VTLEAILKHAEANIVKFITGDRSLSEWSAYVGELNDLGLDDMIALAERAYSRADAQ
jgi:putative aldouronate transport system substrate-binding protein